MNKSSNSDDWLQAELADTLDEDFELELSEPALSEEIRKIYKSSHPPTIERAEYFQHLLTLQAELIKLQDWVQHTKAKIVVVFEGRDAAGKGGAIKRITQRLNPRACRVVALPAPTERANGISNAARPICRRAAKSCCSIAPGTTAPASSA
jgi:polyphosphate kinase